MFGRLGLIACVLLSACGGASGSSSPDAQGGSSSGGASALAGAPGYGGTDGFGGNPTTTAPDRDGDTVTDSIDLDSDGDGLADADEATYGTDPTNPDTDGNGCYDFVDVTFGECLLDSNRVASKTCKSPVGQARLVLRVRNDFTASLDDVTVVPTVIYDFTEQRPPVTVVPIDVIPTGAAVIAEGTVSAVAPGALLGVVVQVTPAVPNVVVRVDLVSASLGVLARGSLIITRLTEDCSVQPG